MVIDPMLYEKISGRSGDPASRLGSALSGMDAARSKREARRDRIQNAARVPGRGLHPAIFRLFLVNPIAALVLLGVVIAAIAIVASL